MPSFELDPDVKVVLPDGTTHHLTEYLLPGALLMLAALMLITSIFLPYWSLTLKAPQYPKGLVVQAYVSHLEGDMREIDGLNHYLGMPPLDEGGRLERSVSMYMIVALGLLLMAGVFVHNWWAAILAVPTIAYPFVFLADLGLILYRYGHSIDPKSALGSAIQPFTPPILGEGKIGQFGTVARPEIGLILAFGAVIVVLIGLWYHRAAYKPIVDARKRMQASAISAPVTQA